MTTPLVLNVVIVSTKHLLHVYHCQQSILLNVGIQSPDSFYVQVVQVGVKNMLVLRWSQRAHCFFCSRPKGHIRAPKGYIALWKRPSENPA